MPFEKARHLGRILEKAVRMPFETEAGIVDGAALADAGNDVLQHAARGMMIEDVTHRDGRHACGLSGLLDLPQAQMLVGGKPADQGHVGPVFENALQAPQIELQGLIRMIPKQHCEQALVPGLHIFPGEAAFAFACPALADAQESAETGIGGAIGGVDEKRCAVVEIEPAADHEAHAGFLRRLIGPHDPGQRIAVDDPERREAEEFRLLEHLARARGAAQEGEMRGDLKLGIGHAKNPCIHQRPPSAVGASRKSQNRVPCSLSTR